MKTLSSWAQVNEGFYAHFVQPFKDTPFKGSDGIARPAKGGQVMIKRLDHNVYRCSDSEETRKFYEDFLGLRLAGTLEINETMSGGARRRRSAQGTRSPVPHPHPPGHGQRTA